MAFNVHENAVFIHEFSKNLPTVGGGHLPPTPSPARSLRSLTLPPPPVENPGYASDHSSSAFRYLLNVVSLISSFRSLIYIIFVFILVQYFLFMSPWDNMWGLTCLWVTVKYFTFVSHDPHIAPFPLLTLFACFVSHFISVSLIYMYFVIVLLLCIMLQLSLVE